MKDWMKIGIGCFIGGIVFCATAMWLMPDKLYMWVAAFLAGGAAGYFGYDLREVAKAIQVMLGEMLDDIGTWPFYIRDNYGKAKDWLCSKPHPFLFPSLVLGLWPAHHIFSGLFADAETLNILQLALSSILLLALSGACVVIFSGVLSFLAFVGSRDRGRFFYPFMMVDKKDASGEDVLYNYKSIGEALGISRHTDQKYDIGVLRRRYFLEEKNRREIKLGYLNAMGYILFSLLLLSVWYPILTALTVIFVVLVCISVVLTFIGQFIWNIIKMVHCFQRVLCAVDGVLGGFLAYKFLVSSAGMDLVGQGFVMLVGGLLGTAFGILNWNLVSVKCMKVHEMKKKLKWSFSWTESLVKWLPAPHIAFLKLR
ncbi:MAG: hypothetical protein ABIJ92_04325 [Candidatus Aenigmatarchaeota archaeon]